MNLSTVKSIAIPEGNATSFSIGGVKVWSVPQPSGSPWDEVAAAIADGTYKTKYKIGDMVPLDLGSEGLINMQIAAFDTDALADGTGTAAISWVAKELLKTSRAMNSTRECEWADCEMRVYLKDTVKPLIPESVRSMIQPVAKTHRNIAQAYVTSEEDVWIPSYDEVGKTGCLYSDLFSDKASRIKVKAGGSKATSWWIRERYNTRGFYYVATSGVCASYQADTTASGVCLCFCTGKTPT